MDKSYVKEPTNRCNGIAHCIYCKKAGPIIPIDTEVSTTENLIAKLEPSIRALGRFSEYFVLGLLI